MTLLLLALGGCSDEAALLEKGGGGGDSGSADEDSGGDTSFVPGECPPDAGYVGESPRLARTLAGEGTWTLDFDSDAEARGYVDCSYHRDYPAMTEVEGHSWQCPDCDWFATGETFVDEGYEACFLTISTADATRTESLGFAVVDGEPHLWRTGAQNTTLSDMGPVSGSGTAEAPFVGGWIDEGTFEEGGGFTLTATLSFTQAEATDVLIHDVNVPREGEYACGWPTCNPGGEAPSWVLSTGGVLPNARLTDACGEAVDLWDFWGRYLVIDASSPDCGPCQAMARDEAAWVLDMRARGIEVEWITLLNASLGQVNAPASADQIEDWVTEFAPTGPVLADEGYAYDVFMPYRGDGSTSFPTIVVVDPQMRVLGWDAGYSPVESGGDGFGPIEALITAGG